MSARSPAGGGRRTVIDARALRRLAAMDIQTWRVRARKPAVGERSRPAGVSPEGPRAATAAPAEQLPQGARRIRLEAGSGRWLLVIDDAHRARFTLLIEDMRGTLGVDNCRFGTWSDSAEAGVAPEDWQAHGIRHALVFSGHGEGHNSGNAGPAFVPCGELQRLATSGQARRALWQQLKSLLEH